MKAKIENCVFFTVKDTVEMTSTIQSTPNKNIGDDRSIEDDWVELNFPVLGDAHLNKVSGVCASIRVGKKKLSDIKLDI